MARRWRSTRGLAGVLAVGSATRVVGRSTFNRGDAIVHLERGDCVVVSIQERQRQGDNSREYQIELLGWDPALKLMNSEE